MTYEIVDAKRHHVGAILRRMRTDHRAAMTGVGVDLHRDLARAYEASYFRKAGIVDGKLGALGGFIGSMASGSIHIWLVLSGETVETHAKELAKVGREMIEYALRFHSEIVTTVPFGDDASMRFARYCGFETTFPMQPTGFITMVRRRESFQAPMKRHDANAAPFMVFTAGRSRTAWLSAFLTYADWACFHEIAVHFRSMEQVAGFFRHPRVGTAETAAAPGWRLLRHYLPEMKFIVVRRPVDEIVSSMIAMAEGIATFDHDKLRKRIAYEDRILEQIGDQPGTVSVNFSDLDSEAICAGLFEHCLPYWFDRGWWERVRHQNIQGDVREIFRYYSTHVAEITEFKRHCKAEMMRLARANLLVS